MKNHIGKIFIAAAVIAIGASIVYAQYAGKQANVGITITPHIRGNETAVVKLVEYGDFQCPACGQFEPVVQEVMNQYGDQISFEFKHFPLISVHPFAVPAARASEAAAQQGKFWEMHDILYAEQNTWSKGANPLSYFITYAEKIGLNVDQFKTQYKASAIEDSVTADFKAARDLGLSGTPTFFLNGTQMEFTTVAEFKTQIETALGVNAPVTDASSTVPAAPTVQFGI